MPAKKAVNQEAVSHPPAMMTKDALVFSLCEQRRLPVLVTDLIVSYLDGLDLFVISTLSRNVNKSANALIYHNLVINLDVVEHSDFGKKAMLLLRTLLTSKTASSAVRSISLSRKPLLQWRRDAPRTDLTTEDSFKRHALPESLIDMSAFTPKDA